MLQAIDTALSRASQAEPAFSPEKKKKGNLLDESYELQRSAFMAARAALKGAVSTLHDCVPCIYKVHVYMYVYTVRIHVCVYVCYLSA